MLLYHTGFETIKEPDVHYGRKNADFGQGFYLTENEAFAHRWAREREGKQIVVNTYELDVTGLAVYRFERDVDWFKYIYANRHGKNDILTEDVIIGPIANDTLYNTFGIMTSGLLSEEEAMRLLLIGPEYHQVALKTERAVGNLKWLSSAVIEPADVMRYRKTMALEEEEYQKLLAKEMANDG